MEGSRASRKRFVDRPLVGIVDDDEAVRDSISSLVRSAGFRAVVFSSAELFLGSRYMKDAKCLIVDQRMPGLSGLELQRRLTEMECPIHIIFVTSHSDDYVRAQALEQGAIAFLPKPFSEDDLLDAMYSAVKA